MGEASEGVQKGGLRLRGQRGRVDHTLTIADLDVDLVVEGGKSNSVSVPAQSGPSRTSLRFHPQMTGELTVERSRLDAMPGPTELDTQRMVLEAVQTRSLA